MGQVQDPPVLQTIDFGDTPANCGATNALVVSDQATERVSSVVDNPMVLMAGFYRDDSVTGVGSVDSGASWGAVDSCGRQIVVAKSAGCIITSVSAATSSVTLLIAEYQRVGASFYNDSTATASLSLDGAASATNFTVKLRAGAYYELPFGFFGEVNCIWDVATGAMRITEAV